ncbi:hypothetical protein GCM10018793_58620 [Streptomyces sulfonofaciens]|uniref:Uncharacterized protein n=1 Tax=Streptomyces sulfonofaciens TaxID=68272 RepID=A0A919GKU2_9ACTN|nr:carbohydrate-binding protein [Streptomyces sulfonofaciens]GHH86497.1 hypothetical protein GCM10018793_58620 [Streptomyces sulfonofaciens]
MRSLKSTVAVLAAAAAMVLGCGPGTATASPANATHTAAHLRVADVGVCSTAVSGRTVRGALSQQEVHSRLSSLTAQHRERYGIAAKGPLGTGSNAVRLPLVDIHPAQGTAFKAASGADGACATQSVSTQLRVQDGYTTIYTPTLYPPGGSCVELVTVYTQSVRSVSAWDWCRSVNFAASVPIDSSFLNTYTGGSGAYTGRVVRTSASSNTWSAALYNYSTGRWDTLFTQSGTNQSGRTDGWDIEELYSTIGSSGRAYSCDAMAGLAFESSNISVRNNGAWSAATSANSDTHYDQPNSAFYCPNRSFQMVSAYDHWKAVG